MSMPDLVPEWTVSSWIYPSYAGDGRTKKPVRQCLTPEESSWVSNTIDMIKYYNGKATGSGAMNMVHCYGSDIELPLGEKPNAPLTDPANLQDRENYGFYFDDCYTKYIEPYVALKQQGELEYIVPIVDARVDHGYLMGMNQMRWEDIAYLAQLVCNGGQSQGTSQTGVCQRGDIDGIQFDIEPFDPTSMNQQLFYRVIGSEFAKKKKFYSIFTFAEMLDQMTADTLNYFNNGYAIVSLYDLPYNAALPIDNSGKVNKSLPQSPEAYGQLVYNEALLAFQKSAELGIKIVFGVPFLSASCHEYEKMYQYNYTPGQAGAGSRGNVLQQGTYSQQQYAEACVANIPKAMEKAKSMGQFREDLYRGLGLWGMSPHMVWAPQEPVVNWDTGIADPAQPYYVDLAPGYPEKNPDGSYPLLDYAAANTGSLKPGSSLRKATSPCSCACRDGLKDLGLGDRSVRSVTFTFDEN